jgi:hypothetical protein
MFIIPPHPSVVNRFSHSFFFPACFTIWLTYTVAPAQRTPCVIPVNTASSTSRQLASSPVAITYTAASTIPQSPRIAGICLSGTPSDFLSPIPMKYSTGTNTNNSGFKYSVKYSTLTPPSPSAPCAAHTPARAARPCLRSTRAPCSS